MRAWSVERQKKMDCLGPSDTSSVDGVQVIGESLSSDTRTAFER